MKSLQTLLLIFASTVALGAQQTITATPGMVTKIDQNFTELYAFTQGVSIDTYGAVGNGSTDDTTAVQAALTDCSTRGLTLRLTTGKTYKITTPLYMWGRCNLVSTTTPSTAFGSLRFSVGSQPYLFNIGISGVNLIQEPWSGTIKNVDFTMVAGSGQHRLIFFWRTDGGTLDGNSGETGALFYSMTSSGNDNAVLSGLGNYVRRNLTVVNNIWKATGSDATGSEGFGFAWFDGLRVINNRITGVGDDTIAAHFCENVLISDNVVTGVDGRIFVSNSKNVVIRNNIATRSIGGTDGIWHVGVGLIWVGHEFTSDSTLQAPENIIISNNLLRYPSGANDAGAAININGARKVSVTGNMIINDSSTVTAKAVSMSPTAMTNWTDPTGIDTTVSKLRDITVSGNTAAGVFPLGYTQTGSAANAPGPIVVSNNIGEGFGFQGATTTYLMNNGTGIVQEVPYSASITVDPSQGPYRITVTDTSAFTINAPVTAIAGNYQQLGTIIVFNIKNTSGGAMGAITWNSIFTLAGAFTNPANGKQRTIAFMSLSNLGVSNRWSEIFRSQADVDN